MKTHLQPRHMLAGGLMGLFLLIGVLWLVLPRVLSGDGLYAQVTVQGEAVMEIPLDQETEIWDLWEDYGVPVQLERDQGRIRFINVECPDHICEKTGWLSMAHQSAVCMPNRTVVTIYRRG